jgi:hypothetical protein
MEDFVETVLVETVGFPYNATLSQSILVRLKK